MSLFPDVLSLQSLLHAQALALVVGFVVCVALVRLVGRPRVQQGGFRAGDYCAKRLLTAWEVRALAEMKAELPNSYHACPQVRLADLVEITVRDPGLCRAALNRVASKSVDFAIIDGTGRAVLVIELDDRSHDRDDRRLRDQLVNAVLAQCQLPLLRVRPGQPLNVGRHLAAAAGRVVAA